MTQNLALQQKRDLFKTLVDIGEAADTRHGSVDPAEAQSWREWSESCTRQASLHQLKRDFLVRWNEGVGAAVEAFWQEVADQELPIPRKKDLVEETLKRGKILRPEHFFELEDHFEELQECGKISGDEADRLNEMLDRFEANSKHFDKVRSQF